MNLINSITIFSMLQKNKEIFMFLLQQDSFTQEIFSNNS